MVPKAVPNGTEQCIFSSVYTCKFITSYFHINHWNSYSFFKKVDKITFKFIFSNINIFSQNTHFKTVCDAFLSYLLFKDENIGKYQSFVFLNVFY